MKISLTDNSDEVLKALKEKVEVTLRTCGQTAEGYAKEDCPVDTGRLRNSITYATTSYQSPANANPPDYQLQGKPAENEVVVGTNVEYAPYVEYGDMNHKVGKKHFLRDSLAKHQNHYKSIIKAAIDS